MSTEGETAPPHEEVLVSEPADGVRVLALNRPRRLNALTSAVVRTLIGEVERAEDDDGCRAIVLTGTGRGFCSGWDVGQGGDGFGQGSAVGGMRLQRATAALVRRLRTGTVPVIAAVNGPASGGGFALALACDLRVATTSARFDAGFVRLGLSGGDLGTSWLLPRAIGSTRAFELLLTGRAVDGTEAERIGLVSSVHPDGAMLAAAVDLASSIAGHPPFAVGLTKEVLWANLEVPSLYAAMELENRTQILATTTQEHIDAVAAFRTRRSEAAPEVPTER